jgi:hypothetical protein
MKYKNHPISRMQCLQQEFERTLPSGRFFSADNNEAMRQYGHIMGVLGVGDDPAQTALPKAFVATLAAANQLNMDLAKSVNEELPDGVSFSRGALAKLSILFAREQIPTLDLFSSLKEPGDIDRMVDSDAADIAGHMARIHLSSCAPHIVLIGNATDVRDRRQETEEIIKFAARDIITMAGILVIRGTQLADRKYDLEAETKKQWAAMSAAYVI